METIISFNQICVIYCRITNLDFSIPIKTWSSLRLWCLVIVDIFCRYSYQHPLFAWFDNGNKYANDKSFSDHQFGLLHVFNSFGINTLRIIHQNVTTIFSLLLCSFYVTNWLSFWVCVFITMLFYARRERGKDRRRRLVCTRERTGKKRKK